MSLHPRLLAVALVSAAAAFAAPSAGAAQVHPCAGVAAMPAAGALNATANATLCLLNEQRAEHDLRPLKLDAKLAVAAKGHSADMVKRSYFSHTAPGNVTFATRILRTHFASGAARWTIGENLAWGSGTTASPAAIVKMWMHSPEHRANILDPAYREIGIGIARGVPTGHATGATYTTDFGFIS